MYNMLAKYYDLLMKETDYDAIFSSVKNCLDSYGDGDIKSVADIGCGTGKISIELSKAGYEVIGVDISPDMLAEAEKNTREAGQKIQYICQDMTELNLGCLVDACVCCLDGINYLSSSKKLISCFRDVKKSLRPGGLFVFDLNTPTKFEKVYAENDFIIEQDGVLCAWSNYFNKEAGYCDFQLSFFERQNDGRYIRSDENQREYCYSKKTILSALLLCGLNPVSIVSAKGEDEEIESCERWLVVAKA